MFNRKLLAFVATAGLIAFGGFSSNVYAASVNGNASVDIVTPLSIAEDTAMYFGQVSPDADNATTVTLTAAGAVSSPDGAGIAGGTPAAGQFTVTGSGSLTYSVSYVDGTLTGPGTNMTVTNFTDDSTGTLSSGTETFNVGADLQVGAGQTTGNYTGTYQVTVTYN
jgi:hypothetical protein